jgi:hypothetical protein
MIRSPLLIVYGLAKVNVYSAYVVPNEVEFIVSMNVATTESSDFLLIFALMIPDGVPVFFNLTFHNFSSFVTSTDDAFAASTPYLVDPPAFRAADWLPGIATL